MYSIFSVEQSKIKLKRKIICTTFFDVAKNLQKIGNESWKVEKMITILPSLCFAHVWAKWLSYQKCFYRVCQGSRPLWISKLSQIWKWNTFCIIYKTLYLTWGHHALGVILCLCLHFLSYQQLNCFCKAKEA